MIFSSFSDGGVFLGGDTGTEFSSGGGSFLSRRVISFSFFWTMWGRVTLTGGEIGPLWPSRPTRPAINNGPGG